MSTWRRYFWITSFETRRLRGRDKSGKSEQQQQQPQQQPTRGDKAPKKRKRNTLSQLAPSTPPTDRCLTLTLDFGTRYPSIESNI